MLPAQYHSSKITIRRADEPAMESGRDDRKRDHVGCAMSVSVRTACLAIETATVGGGGTQIAGLPECVGSEAAVLRSGGARAERYRPSGSLAGRVRYVGPVGTAESTRNEMRKSRSGTLGSHANCDAAGVRVCRPDMSALVDGKSPTAR